MKEYMPLFEKFSDCSIDGQAEYDMLESSIEELKEKYPNAIITFEPFGDRFPGSYFARLDIKTQGGQKEYLGALKGPVSKESALDFFKKSLESNYDKYY